MRTCLKGFVGLAIFTAPLLLAALAGCSKPTAPGVSASPGVSKTATGQAPARGVMQAGSRNRKH